MAMKLRIVLRAADITRTPIYLGARFIHKSDNHPFSIWKYNLRSLRPFTEHKVTHTTWRLPKLEFTNLHTIKELSTSSSGAMKENNEIDKMKALKRKLIYINIDIGDHDLNVKKKMIHGYLHKGLHVTVIIKMNMQLKQSSGDLERLQNKMMRMLSEEYGACGVVKQISTQNSLLISPRPQPS